jgi:ADP-heptose:LPS heptosyltransferase
MIYISGGLLGDFIHQLSIINENYIKYNKKSILYITNTVGDPFRFGVQKAYEDTYNFIIKQPYIEEYKIYNGEQYDVDLSLWRSSNMLYQSSWKTIFEPIFSVQWGSNQWLTYHKDEQYKNKIIINISISRFPDHINYNEVLSNYPKEDVIYVTQNIDDYNHFLYKTGINLPVFIVPTLEEFVIIINSCYLFIGNLSSPLAIAHALHKQNITLLLKECPDNIHSFSDTLVNFTKYVR